MTNAPIIEQVRTGKAKKLGMTKAKAWKDRPWKTAIYKQATNARVWLGKQGLSGDEVGDTKNHGGPEKAVFAYSVHHYQYWQNQLQMDELDAGMMGENFVIRHLDEWTVCIGDVYTFGDAVIQVSQPRRPCWRPARRLGHKTFSLEIQNSGLTGWYFRVLNVGYVEAGQPLSLIRRPHPKWSIAACNDVMYQQTDNQALTAELAACYYLAGNWKQTLEKRLHGTTSKMDKRLLGPNR